VLVDGRRLVLLCTTAAYPISDSSEQSREESNRVGGRQTSRLPLQQPAQENVAPAKAGAYLPFLALCSGALRPPSSLDAGFRRHDNHLSLGYSQVPRSLRYMTVTYLPGLYHEISHPRGGAPKHYQIPCRNLASRSRLAGRGFRPTVPCHLCRLFNLLPIYPVCTHYNPTRGRVGHQTRTRRWTPAFAGET